MVMRRLFQWLFGKGAPREPEPLLLRKPKTILTASDAAEVIAHVTSFCPKLKLIQLDNLYYLPTDDEARAMIEYVRVHQERYVAEKRDCEYFMFSLKVEIAKEFGCNSVGLVIDRAHAYNLIVCTDRIIIIEPQTGMVVAKQGRYSMQRGVVLI